MPKHSPRFWIEILILGFMLVFGMAALTAWLNNPWAFIMRVLYAGVLFATYARHYERTWSGKS